MQETYRNRVRSVTRTAAQLGLSLAVMAASGAASADEEDAKRLLNAMSEYLATQDVFSFDYDSTLEVVTADDQVLAIAASGALSLSRPNQIQAARRGGFADVELTFDGETLTIFGKDLNLYAQIEVPGTIDHLVDELRNTYHRPLPAADLLLSDSYDALMTDVLDVKDLGSGVIGGVECDSLAFRTEEVDWQIWIAHGDRPYPCRYVITSKLVANAPQYSVQISNWKAGDEEVAATDFSFANTTDAKKVELEDLQGTGEIPENFELAGEKSQ